MTEPSRLPPELSRLGENELLVSECYASVQGESTHAGRPCFFIRLTGCPLRCAWCDSEFTFHAGTRRSVAQCGREAVESGCRLVEVTGGEPLVQPAARPLLAALCDEGLEVLLETSGAVAIDGVDSRVRRIVDCKAPGSGEAARWRDGILEALRPGDEVKIVLLNRDDYEWARARLRDFAARRPEIGREIPVLLSPVHGQLEVTRLIDWMLEDRLPARLNLQIHKYVWPERNRGV